MVIKELMAGESPAISIGGRLMATGVERALSMPCAARGSSRPKAGDIPARVLSFARILEAPGIRPYGSHKSVAPVDSVASLVIGIIKPRNRDVRG